MSFCQSIDRIYSIALFLSPFVDTTFLCGPALCGVDLCPEQLLLQALVQALLSQGNTVGKLSSLAAIRRHPGWAMAVELEPKSEVTEKQAAQAVERLNTLRPQLASYTSLNRIKKPRRTINSRY